MFRTRDFVLFFTAIIFLVSAIGVTFLKQQGTEARQNVLLPTLSPEEASLVEGVVLRDDSPELDRENRLERLKQKIAESGVVSYSQPDEVDIIEEDTENTESIELVDETIQSCPVVAASPSLDWDSSAVSIESVEGLRQYFVTKTIEVASTTASTTDFRVEKDVHLSLPIKFAPLENANCLPTDIIGVALGGSLIQNTEVGLYSLFSSNTLLGYALDGFPIYGTGDSLTDICGGRMVAGQYRYEISKERDTIISCFKDTPRSFQQ